MHSERDGGCRVGKVRASTTSPKPDRKGFKLQELANFQKFSSLRVNFTIQILSSHRVGDLGFQHLTSYENTAGYEFHEPHFLLQKPMTKV